MKHLNDRISARLIGAALTLALAAPAGLTAEEKPERSAERFPHYTITDLGTLGGAYSFGYGLNNAGVVSGGAATPTQDGDPTQATSQAPQTGFLWHRGHIRNLGTLGGPNSEAGGPNLSSESALISETATLDPHGEDFCFFGGHLQCLAATWKNGVLKPLLPFPGGNNSQALGLNDRGQVIGFAETGTLDLSCIMPNQTFQFQAAIWEPGGRLRQLLPLPGDTVGFGLAINNKGQAVGGSGLCSNTVPPESPNSPHAVLWEKDGNPLDLGSLGGTLNIGAAINNRGDVVGGSSTASSNGSPHAFLWTKETGKMQDLGTLPGDILSVAPCCNTINNHREIVGFSLDPTFKSRAFLWKDGVMMDLNRLIPEHSPWTLQNTAGINESGQIVGSGLIYGQTHAFLATPCHRHEDRGESCEEHDH